MFSRGGRLAGRTRSPEPWQTQEGQAARLSLPLLVSHRLRLGALKAFVPGMRGDPLGSAAPGLNLNHLAPTTV